MPIFFVYKKQKLSAQLDLELEGYHQYSNYAEKKGYSGNSNFQAKFEPLSVFTVLE